MTSKSSLPVFLSTPSRPEKPRLVGLSHVLDKGSPLARVHAILASVADFIDIWKFGWGTSYLDRELTEKVIALDAHGVRACTGGTLLEVAWLQDKTEQFFDWVVAAGFHCVEVSNGATGMPTAAKRALIARARDRGLDVLSEVGSKNPEHHASPQQWVDEILEDLATGALWVVAEGRESGTVGLYDAAGEVRRDVVEAIEHEVDGTRLIYEAPRRNQQAWLIRHLGPNVNLGNISVEEITSVETLRLGLRADTIGIGLD